METRRCSRCGERKPKEGFGPRPDRGIDARRSRCRTCEAELRRHYGKTERARAVRSTYRRRRREEGNPEQVSPEVRRGVERRRWDRLKNDSEFRRKREEMRRSWRARHPERVLQQSREGHRRSALGRDVALVEWANVLRADPCSYCAGPGGTLDHIDPTINGGLSAYDNLAGACLSCNSSKSDQRLLAFLLRKGNYPLTTGTN